MSNFIVIDTRVARPVPLTRFYSLETEESRSILTFCHFLNSWMYLRWRKLSYFWTYFNRSFFFFLVLSNFALLHSLVVFLHFLNFLKTFFLLSFSHSSEVWRTVIVIVQKDAWGYKHSSQIDDNWFRDFFIFLSFFPFAFEDDIV